MIKRLFSNFRRGLVRLVTRDYGRKILALFLALVLYFTVNYRLANGSLRFGNVPVTAILPDGVVNVDNQIPPVEVTVAGSLRKLNSISSRDIQASVRIPAGSFVPGVPYELKLSPEDFRLPSGVRVQEVAPREILLNLEPLITRRVPVEPRFDSPDRLSPDYRVDRAISVPHEVSVTGPALKVNELRQILTRPIPLDHTVRDSFDYSVDLRLMDDLKISPSRVTVRIEIARKYSNRSFRDVPVSMLMSPEKSSQLAVELPKGAAVEAVLAGPESVLAGLKSQDLRCFLDLNTVREPGTYDLPVECRIIGRDGQDLQIRLLRPERITVKIEVRRPTEATNN